MLGAARTNFRVFTSCLRSPALAIVHHNFLNYENKENQIVERNENAERISSEHVTYTVARTQHTMRHRVRSPYAMLFEYAKYRIRNNAATNNALLL